MSSLRLRQSIARQYRLFRCARRIGSYAWAKRLFEAKAPAIPAQAGPQDDLVLAELRLRLSAEHSFALRAYGNLLALKASGFGFAAAENGELDARISNLCVRLNSIEEIFILKEIFSEHVYDLAPAENALVVDIGMNVGFASLFFAWCWPGSNIEAFEPFPATFARAQYQFSLNRDLAARINANPFGLWKADERATVRYSAESKGATGLWGVQGKSIPGLAPHADNQEMQLRDAAAVLGPLLPAPGSRLVVLKIDCEGGEYGIFDRLAKAGLADRFDVILMEWHRLAPDHDPRRLRELLTQCGYRSVCPNNIDGPVGMIYACKRGIC